MTHLLKSRVFLALLCLMAFTAVSARELEPGSPMKLNLVVLYDYDEQTPEKAKAFFEESSRRLFEATEGQIQLGKIEVHVDCPAVKDKADMVIQGSLAGVANSHVGGFFIGGQMYFPQGHIIAQATGFGDGPTSFLHEIGHYLFFLRDEYQGISNSTVVPGHIVEVPAPPGGQAGFAENPNLFFCTTEGGRGSACYMNSGLDANPQKREFCTVSHHTRHNRGVATGVGFSVWEQNQVGNVHLTDQESLNMADCWSHINTVFSSRGMTINVPQEGAQTTPGTPADIEFEVKTCSPAISLVLDCSGSMDASRMASMKRSASQAIGLLEDGTKLGIVAYSSSASVLFPMQELNSTNRLQALATVAALSAAGNTNIGGGILAGLNQLTSQEPRTEPEVIMLLTDGEHNTGTDPAVAMPQVIAAGVTLNSVGLGASINASDLQLASEQTGGSLVVVKDDRDLASAIIQQSTSVQGDSILSSRQGTLAPGESISIDIPVDTFADQLSVASSWSTGSVQATLTRPNGQAVTEPPVSTANSSVLRLTGPSPGSYRLTLQANADNTGPTDFDTQILARSPSLFFRASIEPTGAFPAPYKIQALTSAHGYTVAGAQVRAVVRDPNGENQEITLYDDGAQGHGDDIAADGTYSNLLSRLTSNGIYEVKLLIVNEDGRGVPGAEQVTDFVPQPVAPYRREVRSTFVVNDFEALGDGSLQLEPETNQIPDYSLAYDQLDPYMLRFRLRTGQGEPVRLTALKFSNEGSGDAGVVSAKLFLDADKDGFIDSTGPSSRPLATGSYDPETGQLTLLDPLTLQPDQVAHFILAYRLPPAASLFAQAAAPLLVLAVILFGLRVRRARGQRLAAASLVTLACLTMTGCGSGEDSYVHTTTNGDSQPSPSYPAQTFSARLVEVQAEGAVTGTPISVSGFSAVTGPVVTLE